MKTVVLINAAAGARGGAERLSAARDALDAAGVAAEIRAVAGAGMEDAARQAVAAGAEMVVAGGGDGTVNAVAGVVVGTNVVLGVLPMGTLNHFARDLGLPPKLDHAAQLLAAGPGGARAVDVGEVNGRRFVNNASVGLYAHIVSRRERQQHRLGRNKWVALLVAAASVLRRYPMLEVVLDTGERATPRRTPFLFVGNNRYEMNLLSAVGRTAIDRGELSLYFAHRAGRLGLVWMALRGLFGRLDQASDFEAMALAEVTVRTRRKTLRLALDGEVTRMAPPLHFRVLPGALRVIAPPAER